MRKVLKIVQAHEAKGEQSLEADDSPTGKKVTIYGMADDPRWKAEDNERAGIESLLKELRGEKKLDEYGLRDGTIGGWPEVRKALLQVHKVAVKEGWEKSTCKRFQSTQKITRNGWSLLSLLPPDCLFRSRVSWFMTKDRVAPAFQHCWSFFKTTIQNSRTIAWRIKTFISALENI